MAKQLKELTTSDTFGGLNVKSVSSEDNGDGTSTYSVELQGDLVELKQDSFSESESAVSIELPSSIKMLYTDSFDNCSNLTSIDLSNVDADVIEQTSLTVNETTNVVLPSGIELKAKYIRKDTDITFEDLMKNYFYKTDNPDDVLYSVYSYGAQFYNAITSGQVKTWYTLDAGSEEHERTADYPNWYIKSTVKATLMSPASNEIWYKTNNNKALTFDSGFQLSSADVEDKSSTVFAIDSSCIESNTYNNGYGIIKLKTGYTTDQLKGLFGKQETLTEVYIGSGITNLPKYMFRECTSLNILYMSDNVTELGIGAFYACANLLILRMSDNITTLPEYCFFGCFNLYMFNLPNQLEIINGYAFGKCKLAQTYGLYYPNPSAEYPFGEGTSVYTEENTSGVLYTNTHDEECRNIITEDSIYVLHSLGGLTLPASLKTIKDYAFYNAKFEGIILLDKNMQTLPACETNAFAEASITNALAYCYENLTEEEIKAIESDEEMDKDYVSDGIMLRGFTFIGVENLLSTFTKKQVVQGDTTSKGYLLYTFDDAWEKFDGRGLINKSGIVTYYNNFTTYDDVTVQGGYSLYGMDGDYSD